MWRTNRILSELARRDTLDSKQCGRFSRLFCHAVHFAQKPDEHKTEWMRRFVFVLLHKHTHQLMRALAFCLISDVAVYCQWLVEDIDEPSAFSVAFRVLLHADPDQAGVVNWLLNTKFQYAYTPPPTSEDVQRAFRDAHDKFIGAEQDDVLRNEILKTSIHLAKTGHNGCLEVAFKLLRDEMTILEKQFLETKDKELKHKTVFAVPTVPTKMSREQAIGLERQLEWQKCVLSVIIDNQNSDKWKAVMPALQQIAPQIVSLIGIIDSPNSEQFVEPSALKPLRDAVEHIAQLVSEFTNFPLTPTTLPAPPVAK
uniref:Uncharacterized protein n=1 Tax=Caenorhabditis japonica TaxID=281687 RepID=A0A8R1HL81_CAEJA